MPAAIRSAAGAASALGLAWLALAGPVPPAFAHNSVIDEGPTADSTVSSQPGEVWIETSDALLDVEGATSLDVIGPDGRHYATACAAIDGPIASAPAELGPAGEYTVTWRVVSADGHPITGEHAFEWAPADGEPVSDGSAEAACEDASGSVAEEQGGGDAASSGAGDLLWIAAGAVVVIGAGVAAFALTRRRPPGGPGAPEGQEATDAAGTADVADDQGSGSGPVRDR